MSNNTSSIVSKVWSFCNPLRDVGVGYGDYLEQLTYLLFLKMADEYSKPPHNRKLNIPKEFISKILQSLTESGMIESKKGKAGGFKLAKHPSKIKLIDIVEAVDGLESFSSCVLGFPNCSDKNPCPVHDDWGELRARAYDMLNSETLDKFREKTLNKIKLK